LAFLARLELLHALSILYDGQHLAAVRSRIAIALKYRLAQIAIDRRRALPGSAFPRGAGALALRLHRALKALHVHADAGSAAGVHDEVKGQPEGVIELERVFSAIAQPPRMLIPVLRQLRRREAHLAFGIARQQDPLSGRALLAQLLDVGFQARQPGVERMGK